MSIFQVFTYANRDSVCIKLGIDVSLSPSHGTAIVLSQFSNRNKAWQACLAMHFSACSSCLHEAVVGDVEFGEWGLVF